MTAPWGVWSACCCWVVLVSYGACYEIFKTTSQYRAAVAVAGQSCSQALPGSSGCSQLAGVCVCVCLVEVPFKPVGKVGFNANITQHNPAGNSAWIELVLLAQGLADKLSP